MYREFVSGLEPVLRDSIVPTIGQNLQVQVTIAQVASRSLHALPLIYVRRAVRVV
jgi:hypothetical protein